MSRSQPSRRQLLGGFLAGLFSGLCLGKARASAPPPRPKPLAKLCLDGFSSITTYTYDAEGRCTRVEHEGAPRPVVPLSWDYQTSPEVTTFTYFG